MRYKVRQQCETFSCPQCGEALGVNDVAWHQPGEGVFCSAFCAGQDPRQSAVHKRLESLIQHVRKAIAHNRARIDSGATGHSAGGS